MEGARLAYKLEVRDFEPTTHPVMNQAFARIVFGGATGA